MACTASDAPHLITVNASEERHDPCRGIAAAYDLDNIQRRLCTRLNCGSFPLRSALGKLPDKYKAIWVVNADAEGKILTPLPADLVEPKENPLGGVNGWKRAVNWCGTAAWGASTQCPVGRRPLPREALLGESRLTPLRLCSLLG